MKSWRSLHGNRYKFYVSRVLSGSFLIAFAISQAKMTMFRTFLLELVAQSLCISAASPAKKRSGQSEERDQYGAVASESAVCSRVGVYLIKDGGNAADAVSLSEPHSRVIFHSLANE